MFTFLLILHALVAASLVAVILMQRSEGGGLGMGGSPSGLMSARGAADFLTRATTVLATVFVVMSIGLAAYAGVQRAQRPIDTSLARPAGLPASDGAAAGGVPLADPLAGTAAAVGAGGGSAGAPLAQQAAPLPTTRMDANVAAKPPTPKLTPPRTRPSAVVDKATTGGATSGPAARTTDPKLPAPAPAPSAPTAPAAGLPTPKADSTPATTPAPASGSAVPLQH